jgi:hypothetical protein
MTVYEYRVTPAPRRPNRIKGVKSQTEAFAATLAEAINVAAREGWEYVRAEQLPALERRGWFRRAVETVETVLIFRRERTSAEPRLAAARAEGGLDAEPTDGARLGAVERPVPAAAASPLRREPRLAEPAQPGDAALGRPPRLGPAD